MSDTFSDFIQAESTLRISAGTPLELAPKPDGSGFGYRTPVEIAPMPGSATDTAPATVPALDATGAAMAEQPQAQPWTAQGMAQSLADTFGSIFNDWDMIMQGVQPHGLLRTLLELATGDQMQHYDAPGQYSSDPKNPDKISVNGPDFMPAPQKMQDIVDEWGSTWETLRWLRSMDENAFITKDTATGRPMAMIAAPHRMFKNHPDPRMSMISSGLASLFGLESGGMTEFQAVKAGAAMAAGARGASTVNAGINFAQGMPQNNARLHAQRLDKVATGGDVSSSFDRSLRRISMEAAPGAGSPLDKKAGGRYSALPAADQKAINDTMTARALEITNQRLGINLANVVHASGGWERFTNPATVQQGFMSFETAKQAANMLGYLLQQTEVWVNTAKAMTANPKAFAIDLIEVAGQKNLRNDQALVDLFGKLSDADKTHWTGANKTLRDGIIRGYQPIETEDGRVGIRILIDRGGSKIMDYLKNKAPQVLGDVIKQSGYSIEYTIQEAQLYKARNDWTSKGSTNGGNYLRDGRSEARTSDKAQIWSDLNSDRQKLEAEFLGLVDAAERRNGIQPAGKRSGKVKAAPPAGGAQ